MFDRKVMQDTFAQYSNHPNNPWKILITIDLTMTNEKKYQFHLLQQIVPPGKSWQPWGEWNSSKSSTTTYGNIEEILNHINKSLDIYGKNKNPHVYELDISVNSPGGHYRKTESKIDLQKVREMITSHKEIIEDIDQSIQKSFCSKILGY